MKNKAINPLTPFTVQRIKAHAFTLAETLIVIGILGVVAALTLPNLNHATGDKETVTRVMKAYSSITEAFDRAQVVYGNFDTWFNGFSANSKRKDYHEKFANRLSEFLKVSKKECTESGQCTATMADGMVLTFTSDGTIGKNNTYSPHVFSVVVDINGPNKGKNQDGVDVFSFDISKSSNEIIPGGGERTYGDGDLSHCFEQHYCTEWVVKNGNLDYLKADDSGECPDGTILSNTVTSCK